MALLCLGLSALPVHAGTCTAASASQAAVQACVNSASNGDTVNVPTGSATWSSAVTVNGKSLIIQCTGTCTITNNAFFLENITSACNPLTNGCTTPTIEIKGFTFNMNTGAQFKIQDVQGFRIDHNTFVKSTADNCIVSVAEGLDRNWGVIDHNTATYCQWETLGGDFGNPGNSDNYNWSDPDPTGTQNVVDYEDNTSTNPDPTSGGYFNCFDSYQGGFYIARFNTFSGCRFEAHGLQGDNSRGSRGSEIYNNTISGGSTNPGYSPFFQRGGVHHIFHNTLDSNWLHNEIRIDTDRAEEDSIAAVGQVPNWQMCDGTTKSTYWTDSVTTPSNTYVTFPSNKTIIVDGAGTGGYPCRDGFGAGRDATLWTSTTFATTPPTQAIVPGYIWKNPLGGSEPPITIVCETASAPGNNLCLNDKANLMVANKNFYSYNASYNGTSGIGEGVIASRPSTCTQGTAYWATNQASWNTTLSPNTSGMLHICGSSNWTNETTYTPLTYPNPLLGGSSPPANTPTFSPVAGTYGSTQNVTISTTSSGAIICYNTTGSPATNGTTGCTTGTLYTGAVSVPSSQTLYAVAGGSGYVDSSVGSAAYVINTVPLVSLSPTSLGFAREVISTTSSGQSVTLTNTGNATLNISSIALTAGTQYAITTNTCSSTLAASLSCSVTVTFSPLTTGAKSDSLVFTTNASSSPDSVPITGGGIPVTQVYDWNVPTGSQLCTNSNTGTNIVTPAFIASHAYTSVRMWVQPTTPNGHFYKVTTTGTSSTEPSWPTGSGSTITSGTVTYTEQGATNAGECLDEYFLYVLPNIDGAALGFNASDLDPSNGGCTAQAGGGYTFSSMDTTIAIFTGASEWGVQDGIVLVLRPGTYSSPNSWTPCYWLSSTYAATLSAAANNVCFCDGYKGDQPAGTNSCSNTGDATGVPVPFDTPFQTAYNLLLAAYTSHIKGSSYHSSIAYARHGISIGGEAFPFCVSQMKVKYSYSTPQIKTAWLSAVQADSNQLLAGTPNYAIDGAINGLSVPGTPGVVGYDWADAEAIIYTNNGQGIGDQGLTQQDIFAFATNGYASGGSASTAGTYCSNDFCYNFHALPGALPAELQMGTVSNPTGAGTGSLVDILPFATQQRASSVEIYNQDLMIAYNPNYPQYSTYHTAYALAIANLRAAILTPTSVPNGMYGAASAGGSVVIH